MRILLVVHYFLPRHVAGTELYTARLAQELRKAHEVALFFTELDVTAGSYQVRRGTYEGIPFTEVVNNHTYWRFRETYQNARLDEIFASLLDTYQPDVVHMQHLANLSLGCVRQAQRRRIPVIYTVHDYWLTCPRNGLRMKESGALCYQVVPRECAPCMATAIRRTSPLRRLHQCIEVWTHQLPVNRPLPLEFQLQEAAHQETWDIAGDVRPVRVIAPPAHLRGQWQPYRAVTPQAETALRFYFALHPAAYTIRNDGAVFKVFVNQQEVFSRYLAPWRRPQDRGWISGEVALNIHKRPHVEFVAKLGPGEDPAHCLAGWGGFVLSPQPTVAQKESLLGALCNRGRVWLRRRLTALDERNALQEIRRRMAAVQQTLSAVDVLIAPSRFLRDRFIEFGVAADKILYLDNGFDFAPFVALPARSRDHGRVVFAYVGTLVEHKGVHILVEAFNRLSPTAAVLRVYGNLEVFPAYTAQLRALATHPGISFAGGFANRDIGRILAEVDALIVPSLWFENSPLTIHEALLAGVPVIASNIGGMAEYVADGKTGLLFQVGDVDDLYDKLNWFCHHRQAFTTMPRPVYSSIMDHTRELVRIYTKLHQQRQCGG